MVVWPSTFQNFLLIRVKIYDNILIQASFCMCSPSLLGLRLSFSVCAKTPTYNWGHPRHLHRHLLHYNTLTQTQDLVLTFDSRVKTILNHPDSFLAFEAVDYLVILHCTEKGVGIRDTPALFSHFLCCCGRILLLCSSRNLLQIHFPSCIKPPTTQSHNIWCTLESHTWSIRWATKTQHSTPVFLH